MPSAALMGSPTLPHSGWSGGILLSGSPTVIINGLPVCRMGDVGTPHFKPDNAPHPEFVAAGSSTVLVNGIPLARMGDPMTCGSMIAAGSPNVIVGG